MLVHQAKRLKDIPAGKSSGLARCENVKPRRNSIQIVNDPHGEF